MTPISGNALTMKEINVNLVRRALKAQGQATKHQIAAATGISTVTVGSILQDLMAANEVFPAGFAASSGGRPAQIFRFNENHAHALVLFTHEQSGLDMLYLRVVNLCGACLHQEDTPLDAIDLHTFEPHIDAALEAYPSIQAIGFGLPGVVLDGSFQSGDYPGLVGADLLPHYAARYGLPVIFENDVNAASVGYGKHAQIDSPAALVYFYFPQKYRPGAGITIDGALYRGLNTYAGEIGGLPSGVDWLDPALYADAVQVSDAIARLVTMTSSLLNPHSVVLAGAFLTEAHLATIQRHCAAQLSPNAVPPIHLARDFTLDYQRGMIAETLALLESEISISL